MRIRVHHMDHRLPVAVEDDGIGLGPRPDSPGAGFGLVLIASLATELELALGPDGRGTVVRMTFAIG